LTVEVDGSLVVQATMIWLSGFFSACL